MRLRETKMDRCPKPRSRISRIPRTRTQQVRKRSPSQEAKLPTPHFDRGRPPGASKAFVQLRNNITTSSHTCNSCSMALSVTVYCSSCQSCDGVGLAGIGQSCNGGSPGRCSKMPASARIHEANCKTKAALASADARRSGECCCRIWQETEGRRRSPVRLYLQSEAVDGEHD